MWEFLGFPEEYRVAKNLNKELFLKHANMTSAEERRLECYLNRIQLLYDIRYSDNSEMVVVHTTANLPEFRNKYFLQNFIRGIAQSFPYHCLIVLQYRSAVKLLLPITRKNEKNDCRMVVEQVIATPLIPIDRFSIDKRVLEEMRECINQAKSSDELQYLWQKSFFALFHDYSYASAWDDMFRYERNEHNKEHHNQMLFENAISLDDPFLEDDDIPVDSEYDDNEYDHEMDAEDDYEIDDNCEFCEYIEFFECHCWPLFEQARQAEAHYGIELEPQKWVKSYCIACSNMMHEQYGRHLSRVELRSIAVAFLEQRTFSAETMPYELMLLKEELSEYDFDAGEWSNDISENDGIKYEDTEE